MAGKQSVSSLDRADFRNTRDLPSLHPPQLRHRAQLALTRETQGSEHSQWGGRTLKVTAKGATKPPQLTVQPTCSASAEHQSLCCALYSPPHTSPQESTKNGCNDFTPVLTDGQPTPNPMRAPKMQNKFQSNEHTLASLWP